MDGYLITGIAIAGFISVAFFVLCIWELLRLSDFPLFFAEWRGLGNGFGGWRLSRPFAFALIGFVFGAGILVTMVEKMRLDKFARKARAQVPPRKPHGKKQQQAPHQQPARSSLATLRSA